MFTHLPAHKQQSLMFI